MTELDWPVIMRKAPHIARKIAREFPGIESSDIEQEIFLYCAENKGSIARTTHTDSGLEGIMIKAGRKYAARERYAFLNYSAEWIYTPDEVRGIFEEAYFDADAWNEAPVKDDGMTIRAKGIVVSLWDIQGAFEALSVEDQIAIRSRYEYGIPGDPSERKRLQRAIDKVTQRINGRMAAKSDTRSVDSATV